jgi:hypothetical protein
MGEFSGEKDDATANDGSKGGRGGEGCKGK